MDHNPAPETPAPDAQEAPFVQASWLSRNLTTLIIVGICALIVGNFLRRADDPVDWTISATKVVVALGLVIFIHELGHFVAAKLCDVHVQTFSIGFGGPLFGICSAKWGETTYKIAWVPLGGYVKMVGEGEENEEHADDPRSYKNKKVWQRMIIISAGVIMNLLLAWLCFMAVYLTHGFDQNPGVIGSVVPGGPAWKKGLRPGDAIRQIGEKQDPYYDELKREVMRAGRDKLQLKYDTFPDGKPRRVETEITPARSDEILAPMLLIQSSSTTTLVRKSPLSDGPYEPGSPASAADPKFHFGDRVIGATDPDNPSQVTPLRADPRHADAQITDYYDFQRRMQFLAGKPMVVRVRRAADGSTADIKVDSEFAHTLGLRMRMGEIVAIRENSPAAAKGIIAREGTTKGDVIQAVEVKEAGGKTLRFSAAPKPGEIPLDPMRLPTQLAQWAAGKPDDYTVTLFVLRPEAHKDVEKPIDLKWDRDWELFDLSNLRLPETPLSLPGLGIAFQAQAIVAEVEKGSPADGTSIQAGDVVTAIDYTVERRPGKTESERRDVKEDQWGGFFDVIHGTGRVKEITLSIKNKPDVKLTPREDKTWPLVERGLIFEQEKRLEKADGFAHAASLSGKRVLITMATIYENLIGLIKGRLSPRAISGPISIAAIAFEKAGNDTFDFIIFIALININLAVVNFLPIPVLDGGHMVFLTYELFRGKPPSERWRVILTIMGLVVVLGLMAFSLLLDLNRWIVEPLRQFLGW